MTLNRKNAIADSRCEGCGASPGQRNSFLRLVNFRGHRVCPGCSRNWRHTDRCLGREATWEEFLNGQPQLREWERDKAARDKTIMERLKAGIAIEKVASEFSLTIRTMNRIRRGLR